MSAAFGSFLDALGADGRGVVAIDGKTLRRSFDRAAGTSALHVVTAFATDAKLVIGQKAVAAGSNEIVAGRALLDLLNLDGTLVTADAIHCQSETAKTVLARGGDYLFALKGNRPALHADVTAFFADPPANSLTWHESSDADHGRVEVRRHALTQSVDAFDEDRARTRKDHGAHNLATLCASSPSTSSNRPGPISPSDVSETAPDGPTPSHEPSSLKCHSPGMGPMPACQGARVAL